MAPRLVRAATLAKRLRVGENTCRYWRRRGWLDGIDLNNEMHYPIESVEKALKWVGDEDERPSFEDILDGRVKLLIPKEVFAQYGQALDIRSEKSFYNHINNGEFGGYFILPRYNIRLTEDSINEAIGRRKGLLTRPETERIFGCAPYVVLRLLRASNIQPVRLRERSNCIYYQRDDIVQLLRQQRLLPEWITPQRWIKDALSVRRYPLTTSEVMVALGVPMPTVLREMEEHNLLYIRLPRSKDRRVSVVSVRALFLAQPVLTPQTIGHIVGATSHEVNLWLVRKQWKCPLHPHPDYDGFRRACLVAMMWPMLSPGLSSPSWFVGREKARAPLTPEEALYERYGISHEHVEGMATQGIIGGLRKPNGKWVFRNEDVRRLSRATVNNWVNQHAAD